MDGSMEQDSIVDHHKPGEGGTENTVCMVVEARCWTTGGPSKPVDVGRVLEHSSCVTRHGLAHTSQCPPHTGVGV